MFFDFREKKFFSLGVNCVIMRRKNKKYSFFKFGKKKVCSKILGFCIGIFRNFRDCFRIFRVEFSGLFLDNPG